MDMRGLDRDEGRPETVHAQRVVRNGGHSNP